MKDSARNSAPKHPDILEGSLGGPVIARPSRTPCLNVHAPFPKGTPRWPTVYSPH